MTRCVLSLSTLKIKLFKRNGNIYINTQYLTLKNYQLYVKNELRFQVLLSTDNLLFTLCCEINREALPYRRDLYQTVFTLRQELGYKYNLHDYC